MNNRLRTTGTQSEVMLFLSNLTLAMSGIMFRILTDFGLTDDAQSDFLWELLFRSVFMNGLIEASGESDQQ
jgi:hypothetical protein